MKPLVVIRPEPGTTATCDAARELGLDVRAYPLFRVRPLSWEPVPPTSFDALLLGSANALRHAGDQISQYLGMPTYVVGQATAEAARDAGLVIYCVGSGGLQSVLPQLERHHRRLLRLTGREHVPLDLPAGTSATTREVYASDPVAMSPELAGRLGSPAVVLLHSGEAARHFSHECDAHGIDRSRIAIAAIGARVANIAGSGWAALKVADSPSDAALLALAQEMCQDANGLQ